MITKRNGETIEMCLVFGVVVLVALASYLSATSPVSAQVVDDTRAELKAQIEAIANGASVEARKKVVERFDQMNDELKRLRMLHAYAQQPSSNGGYWAVPGVHVGNMMDWLRDHPEHVIYAVPLDPDYPEVREVDLVGTLEQIPALKAEIAEFRGE